VQADNPKAPKILQDIAKELQSIKITIAENVGGEGRAGSLQDEQTVIDTIKNNPKFSEYIIKHDDVFGVDKKNKSKTDARKVGDFLVKDYEIANLIHVVNVKTTGGSSDNASSKLGFLIALTNIPLKDLPNTVNWKKWMSLLEEHKADLPNRDYWFLVVDKNNSGNVLVRGAKQINEWGLNPSNDLQIDWSKEWNRTPDDCTYNEAFDKIVGGLRICKAKMALTTASLLYSGNPALMKEVESYLTKLVPEKKKKKKQK
jgi:hypothetical protein